MNRGRVLSLLDVIWWGHRRFACRVVGWLRGTDGHEWSPLAHPDLCLWCGEPRPARRV
ncbi:MAG TPA: hypothetical protein VHB69_02240 [Mycobacteriales bacterium]|nr:hypothetical protein [Mycobacteriales bacterium]